MKRKNLPRIVRKAAKNAVSRKVQGETKVSADAYKAYDEDGTCSFNEEIFRQCRFLVGVDEAGRGPLAGPVAVGIAVVPVSFDWNMIPGVGDSKKVSPKNREAIFRRAKLLKKQKLLDFVITLISSKVIDRIGITHAVALGIERSFKKLKLNPKTVDIRLDGLLKAPKEFLNQKTIIKGDVKEKIIGLASIMAKVTRDQHMLRLSGDYPEYKFEIHKGYGTLTHRNAIKAHGISKVHRKTFTRKFV